MITFPVPATLDHESRVEFWKYCDETFQLCVEGGMPAKEAREFAVEFTSEKVRGFIERQSQ